MEYSEEIMRAVEKYLEDDDWHYEFNEESGIFKFGLTLDSKISNVTIYCSIKDQGYSFLISLPLNATKDVRRAVSEFLTRVNFGIYVGNFEMDFSDGEIRFKSSVPCADNIPTHDQIEQSLFYGISTVKRYANGLLSVMLGLADAEKAYELSEAE